MALYFLLLDAARFHQEIQPTLASCWQRRTFTPALPLVQALLPAAAAFADSHGLGESPLAAVPRGLTFDRARWHLVAGEVLWFAATEVPEIRTAPDVTLGLLGPAGASDIPRQDWPLIRCAYRGAHELLFGQVAYAPDRAGYNGRAAVARIVDHLAAVDPERWTVAQLAGWDDALTPEELQEELDDARACFPALHDLYQRARERGQVVVCEDV